MHSQPRFQGLAELTSVNDLFQLYEDTGTVTMDAIMKLKLLMGRNFSIVSGLSGSHETLVTADASTGAEKSCIIGSVPTSFDTLLSTPAGVPGTYAGDSNTITYDLTIVSQIEQGVLAKSNGMPLLWFSMLVCMLLCCPCMFCFFFVAAAVIRGCFKRCCGGGGGRRTHGGDADAKSRRGCACRVCGISVCGNPSNKSAGNIELSRV